MTRNDSIITRALTLHRHALRQWQIATTDENWAARRRWAFVERAAARIMHSALMREYRRAERERCRWCRDCGALPGDYPFVPMSYDGQPTYGPARFYLCAECL